MFEADLLTVKFPKRIAVVNRGEAAVRLIRAVRELNAEYGCGITTIALHTDAERRAMFVRQADEAVMLRRTSGIAYLDHAELERALLESKADAVWVGWGFVAEDIAFAELCARLKLTFIGPPPAAMRTLGDKVEAKLLAEKVGVPLAPWSGGPVETREDARRHAEAIGYPLIIKARSGGGGRGIRKVFSPDELEVALERTQGEAERSFGDPVVFLERLVTDARHVEVQVIADNHGNVWAPGVRDCSIQRRNQKVIEESSSPLLTKEQADHLRSVSAELVRAAGYRGAGTVEFLYQPDQKVFTFLEVNTRLQVEHPITEVTTGLDLVKLQIFVASGGALEGECPPEFGHAVEARLNAEDADNDFAPAPGTVRLLKFPLGTGIRVDTGIAQGDVIPPDYDSMVAKIIAWGRDRNEALARLRTALRETTVVIDGGTTNKSFLLDLLDRDEVVSATADTGWLDRTGAGTATGPTPTADIALIAAAVDAYEAEESLERAAFLASAHGGRPRATHAIGRTVELSTTRARPTASGSDRSVRAATVSTETAANSSSTSNGSANSSVDSPLAATASRSSRSRAPPGSSSRWTASVTASARTRPAWSAPRSPAVVVAMPVAVGDEVEAGATLVVLESMKMETALRAPTAGRVREVFATVNSQVDAGAALLRFDQVGESSTAEAVPRVQFRTQPRNEDANPRTEALARLGRTPRADHRLRRERRARTHPACRSTTTFAAACRATTRNSSRPNSDCWTRSPTSASFPATVPLWTKRNPTSASTAHASISIRSCIPSTPRWRGCHRRFAPRSLARCATTTSTDLEPGPELEEAVYRLFLALQRMENQVPVITALLGRWLTADEVPSASTSAVGEVLERLIIATQVRYPVIGDIARNLRFRLFDEPQIRKAREQIYDGVREGLQYLADNPDAPDYAARIDALVATPELLIDLLAQRISNPGALLEVVTRQYYEIRALENVKTFEQAGGQFVTGSYELAGQQLHLVSTVTDRERAVGNTRRRRRNCRTQG